MKRAIIDHIEADPKNGHVRVRFLRQHVDENGDVTELGYLRSMDMEPDVDIAAHLKGIAGHIKAEQKMELDTTHLAAVHAVAALVRTPEIVAAHKAAKEKRRAEEEARQQAMAAERAKAQGSTPAHPVPGLGGLLT